MIDFQEIVSIAVAAAVAMSVVVAAEAAAEAMVVLTVEDRIIPADLTGGVITKKKSQYENTFPYLNNPFMDYHQAVKN